jgi:hypothetical protein
MKAMEKCSESKQVSITDKPEIIPRQSRKRTALNSKKSNSENVESSIELYKQEKNEVNRILDTSCNNVSLIPFHSVTENKGIHLGLSMTVHEALENMKLLDDFVNEVLIADVDYGFISGYGKPTLLKSGAEKICNFYRLIPKVEVMNRVDDYHLPFFCREVKITLLDSSNTTVRAEGVGSCNSMESKYRSKDVYSLQNTILKIAKKRALIDAVLNVSAMSSRFTQDIEDIEALEGITCKKPITMKQYKYLCDLIKNNNISREVYFETLLNEFHAESLKQLDSFQVSRLISLFKDSKTQ